MLNHHPSLPGIAFSTAPYQPLDLNALPDDALLERAQQQQRFLLSTSRRDTFRQHTQEVPSRTNTSHEELDGTVKPVKRNQVIHGGTISFTLASRPFRYDLGKIEAKVVDKKRTIYCTSADGDIFIHHDLPTKFKRHLTTDHPHIGNPSEVYFSDTLHVTVKSRFEKIASGDAYIYYIFNDPDAIRQFQEVVREKDLLYTFCVSKIVSANGEEVSFQHLKLWRDRQSPSCSLSFLRNAATHDHKYVEFPLTILEINSTKQPKDSRIVRVGFLSETSSSPPRGLSLDSISFARNRRLSGAGSVASFRTDATNATIRQTEKIKSLAASMDFLLIKFTYAKDVDTFSMAMAYLQSDPPSPFLQPTNTPPLVQGGFPHTLHEDDLHPPPIFSSSPPSISGLTSQIGPRRTTHQDYTVGWIAALPIELKAAIAMLDEHHGRLPQQPQDNNTYVLGRMASHNVVIACLPAGSLGNNSATSVATQMGFTFPNINIRLMVGIGGGVPGDSHDIRLGDVVISKPGLHDGGVVQYDFGKTTGEGFEKTGSLPPPPARLLTAISLLEALHNSENDPMPSHFEVFQQKSDFRYPGPEQDRLFKSDYSHVAGEATCAKCDRNQLVDRLPREGRTRIHYGTIASGNQVMKDARTRDALRQKYGVLCFEMEAAGLMHLNTFPCVVIRGICDYSDTHKNKQWQGYAAAVAVVYAKELLENISHVYESESRVFHDDRNIYSNSMGSIA
ncbi:nucleoside phosphorylase domain-containing protein [Talaromyces proteolyticus]|uniref:Nucleoside phosphorylase domain-containing protein n=1 Tax=Talaromyces proteolyticus TaxID=1131652 RepID=A0AAD4Q3A4_9EURO|nr:nucleoside phosphorylase domain-containing protein [Talaromyces proteolyticus]KAH8701556.1 nucleoside phosphorylase domain-containing protein [Talaromyces proteolyticus]